MSSSSDRRSAVVLLCIALAGAGVRWLSIGPVDAPGAIGYRATNGGRPHVDSVEARADRLSAPLGLGEQIDVDRATAEELLRLPRIGPALATRIVEDRERRGAFGSLDGLGRVSGLGPSTLAAVARYTLFSGAGARPAAVPVEVNLNTASREELMALPGMGPVRADAVLEYRRRHGPFRTIDDLVRVPGIGPKTVERLRSRLRVS